MATIVETVERNGKTIAVYDNGMERDVGAGRIIRPPTSALITRENAKDYIRKRKEKQAALLRAAIKREHNSKMEPIANSSAAAFAESGALLYSEIVLNADAYPRDRLETWKTLGQAAEVLADPRDRSDDGTPNAAMIAALNAASAGALERVWADVLAAQARTEAIDGEARDVEPMEGEE